MNVDDALFQSAPGMAAADNYSDWTFSLFESLVHGDVLEVGCGIGTFTRRLITKPALRRLLAIDVSAAAVAHCAQRVQHPALEVRHTEVQVVEGSFDLIVCMNVLEHIDDHEGALRHMLSLLKPGGALFLLVPAHDLLYSPFDVESGHFRRYHKARMMDLIRRVCPQGLPAIRQFYFNTIGALGYFVVYRLLRKAPRADATSEIGWFDKYVVPLQRRLEPAGVPFGISLITVLTKR